MNIGDFPLPKKDSEVDQNPQSQPPVTTRTKFALCQTCGYPIPVEDSQTTIINRCPKCHSIIMQPIEPELPEIIKRRKENEKE